MPPRVPRSPRANVVAAAFGGLAFGYGVVRLAFGPTLGATVWTVLGAVLLWWAFAEHRKARPGTPESEAGGDHTIE